jgi:hypothetical protein
MRRAMGKRLAATAGSVLIAMVAGALVACAGPQAGTPSSMLRLPIAGALTGAPEARSLRVARAAGS